MTTMLEAMQMTEATGRGFAAHQDHLTAMQVAFLEDLAVAIKKLLGAAKVTVGPVKENTALGPSFSLEGPFADPIRVSVSMEGDVWDPKVRLLILMKAKPLAEKVWGIGSMDVGIVSKFVIETITREWK